MWAVCGTTACLLTCRAIIYSAEGVGGGWARLLPGIELACKRAGQTAAPAAEPCLGPSEEGTFVRPLRNTAGGSSQRYSAHGKKFLRAAGQLSWRH